MPRTPEVSPAPPPPPPRPRPKPPDEDHVAERLIKGLNNPEKNVKHHCFAYAWAVVAAAGGKGIASAPQDRSARGKPTSALGELAESGELHVGDVIYVNRQPGADPSSTNLAYGPHWFVYLGNGKFADQYGVKHSAAEMDAFVPGRRIDTIYHCFNGSPADPPPGLLDAAAGDFSAVGGGGASAGIGFSSGGATPAVGAPAAMPAGKAVPADNFSLLLEKLAALGLSLDWLEELARRYGVPLELILGVIMQESRGKPDAQSGAGAQGLMQLMPATAAALGVDNPFDPRQNVQGGVKYLGQLMDQFGGNTAKVLAGYNAGPGNVEKYGGVPPFTETQHYVANILASLDNARAALA